MDQAATYNDTASGPTTAVAQLDAINEALPKYVHEPLDRTRRSLRVVQILPQQSTNTSIQCVMKNTTLEECASRYTCLSYTWKLPIQRRMPLPNEPSLQGPGRTATANENERNKVADVRKLVDDRNSLLNNTNGELAADDIEQTIIVNGKRMIVGRNLFDFLGVAAIKYTGLQLWIDALCIDQDNHPERVQQVKQMGEIYRHAHEVIVWLGLTASGAEHLEYITASMKQRDDHASSPPHLFAPRSELECYKDECLRAIKSYWSRAWITQEIALARCVKVLAGTSEILAKDLNQEPYPRRETMHNDAFRKMACGDFKTVDLPLLRLLAENSGKQCLHPRDRIFSLLSLSKEGRKFDVDYKCPIKSIVLQMFEHCKVYDCICVYVLVFRSLGLGQITRVKHNLVTEDPTGEEELTAISDLPRLEIRAAGYQYESGILDVQSFSPEERQQLFRPGCLIFRMPQVCSQFHVDLFWVPDHYTTKQTDKMPPGCFYWKPNLDRWWRDRVHPKLCTTVQRFPTSCEPKLSQQISPHVYSIVFTAQALDIMRFLGDKDSVPDPAVFDTWACGRMLDNLYEKGEWCSGDCTWFAPSLPHRQ